MEKKTFVVEINPYSIFFLVVLPIILYFVWVVKDILFSLLIAFILMSALNPPVAFLVKRRIPRPIAATIVYLVFVFILIYLFSLIIPPIIIETTQFLRSLPQITNSLNPAFGSWIDIGNAASYIPNITGQAVGFISGLFSNTLFVISTLFFGFYLLLEEDLIFKMLKKYIDEKRALHIGDVFTTAEERMASWFWGELVLMSIVGLLTYLGLSVIGIKYALPLAVLAGLLEVVPNIGPTIAAVPAILIGFSQAPLYGASAAALAIVIQQLENNVIVPMVMRRAVGINPIITLLVLLIGGRIGGVLGLVLSIPLFLLTETIIQKIQFYRKN